MPGSLVNLFIQENTIKGEAKIPLDELQNALGEQYEYKNPNTTFFRNYFLEHINARTNSNQWRTVIDSATTTEDTDPIIGKYKEVIVYFELIAPSNLDVRKFTFDYDVVIHRVITHKILVNVQQDWYNGISQDHNTQQLGIIELDVPSGKFYALQVDLGKKSWWKGFKGMFYLGLQHIKEGTDHLLFLIMLLLPALLHFGDKQWGSFVGLKNGFFRVLKIITAFTIGHSATLLIAALGWKNTPTQLVEIIIAVSILVSAIHAVYPIFPKKEIHVAAGFGLIHGLAFATILTNLNLHAGILALSIVGFNLGIEFMQLLIIILIIPWLLILNKTPYYKWFRMVFASLAALGAVGWIFERSIGKENFISSITSSIPTYGLHIIGCIAFIALSTYCVSYLHKKQNI
jgi:hypothetical protein